MKASMQKLIAVGLSVMLVVGTLTGCGGDSDNKTASGSATTGNNNGTSSGQKKTFDDLGGMSITISDWYTAPESAPTTDYEKKTEQYRKQIQKDYNFKIKRENTMAWGDTLETYTTQVMANNPKYQLYYLYQEWISEPVLKGLMKDLSKLPEFDFTEEKWNPTVTKRMSIGNGIWGMNIESEPRGGIFFNKRLLKEAGIDPDEPYDLQQNNQWTWEKFEEYCKKLTRDTDGDGKIDQYAMGSFNKYYLKMCAASNNATYVDFKDGKYVNGIKTQEFKDAMNWGVSIIKKGWIMPDPPGSTDWAWYKAAFRDGEVAMQTSEVYEISAFSAMEDEWGFVMFPYNQANPDATNKTVPDDNIVVMPSCFDDETAEKIAFAYDLYTEPTEGFTKEEAYKEGYYPQFKDERAVDETLVMMSQEEHKMPAYHMMISGINDGDFAYGVYALAATPAQQIEKLSTAWDTKINEANEAYAKFAKEHSK